MKKLLLITALTLYSFFTFAQMAPGEEFTGEFRPNNDCQYGWEGYTNFSRWKCLIPVDRPLPVTLVSFEAKSMMPGTIKISWQYEKLPGHEFFILQHSTNAVNWEKISTQKGTNYTHKTRDVNNYYRLLSIDADGTINIYKVIYAKTEQPEVKYYDVYGRLVKNPAPYQLVIGNGEKRMIVK